MDPRTNSSRSRIPFGFWLITARRAVATAGLLALVLGTGCPAKKPGGSPQGPATSRPAAPARAPVAQLVPEGATYVVLARKVTGLVEAARQWLEPLRIVDTELTVASLEQSLRGALGLSLLDLRDLDDAGIDVEGRAALFSTGIAPTLALPIADAQRLQAFFAARDKKLTVRVRDHDGLAVTSWDLGPGLSARRAILDEHLVLHLALRSPVPEKGADLRWIDELVAARSAPRPPEQVRRLIAALPEHRDVVFFADAQRADAASRTLYAEGCRGAAGDTLRTIRGGLRLGARRVALRATVELGAATRRALDAATGAPLSLPATLWDPAPARLRLDLPRGFLREPPAGCAGRACGVVCDLSRDLVAALGPVLRSSWLAHAGGRLAGALLAADERGQLLSVRGGLIAAAPDAAAERFFRGELPVKEGAATRVHGQAVEELSPTVKLREVARASFARGLLHLAAGDGLIAALLAPRERAAAPPGPHRSLVSFALRPAGLADLRVPLKLLEGEATPAKGGLLGLLGGARGYSLNDKVAHLASSFAAASLDVALTSGGIEVRSELELR